jgi:hypothetical protein
LNKKKFITAIISTVYFSYYCFTYQTWHFLDNINLIIHEAGHIIFLPFGEFLHILGGSFWQVVFPLMFVLYFYQRREYFSASVVLFWVGQSLINVSVYASDAIAMQLPLLGGDSSIHDWNALLQMTGLLKYTSAIGSGIFFLGVLLILGAICSSIYCSLYPLNILTYRTET